jgi:hypothetical protein
MISEVRRPRQEAELLEKINSRLALEQLYIEKHHYLGFCIYEKETRRILKTNVNLPDLYKELFFNPN